MCSETLGTIKERLVQQFADLRSTNKEILELGFEVNFLIKQKACMPIKTINLVCKSQTLRLSIFLSKQRNNIGNISHFL